MLEKSINVCPVCVSKNELDDDAGKAIADGIAGRTTLLALSVE